MLLANFGDVYMCYEHIVKQTTPYQHFTFYDFPNQPYKLLEAYSRAWGAVQDQGVAHTSPWERQTGASTTAAALAMCQPDAVILTADHRGAIAMTRMLVRAFPKEAERVKSTASPIHRQVWFMTGMHGCMVSQPSPSLVIVDSETAYRKDRDQAIDDVRHYKRCPVLVLDGPPAVV